MIHKESIYKNYDPTVPENLQYIGPAYWLIYSGYELLTANTDINHSLPFVTNPDVLALEIKNSQYIGELHGQPCYCAEFTESDPIPEGMSFSNLRTLYGVLDEDIFHVTGRALQILTWNITHQYCSKCGSKVHKMLDEMAKQCPACSFTSYPRISPAVITAIFKDNKILLAHNNHFPDNLYSLIAGFVEPGETLEECVSRETMEEVGINVKNIKYFGSQPWPYPHSMMIGFTADYDSGDIIVDGHEIADAHWFDVNDLPDIPSKVSIARKIIDWYIKQHA